MVICVLWKLAYFMASSDFYPTSRFPFSAPSSPLDHSSYLWSLPGPYAVLPSSFLTLRTYSLSYKTRLHSFCWSSSQNRVSRSTPLVRWAKTPTFVAHITLAYSMVKRLKYDFKLSPFYCLTLPKYASGTMNCLVDWNCLINFVLSCCQLVIDPGVIDLNHFLAPLLSVIVNTH